MVSGIESYPMAVSFRSSGLQPYDLGDTGVAHVRESLALGNQLAKAVLRHRVALEAFTLLPSDTDPSRLSAFDVGGTGARQAMWTEFIVRHLLEHPSNVAVAESFEARPDDPAIVKLAPHFVVDSEVYFFTSTPTADSVDLLLRSMSCYTSLVFLSRVREMAQRPDQLSYESLEALAQATRYALVGTYDEESFVCATYARSARTA